MIFKKLLGQVLLDMKIITKNDLELALRKQEERIIKKIVPANIARDSLISESRMATGKKPLLGKTLMELKLLSREQLEEALSRQDETFNIYKSLNIDKLAIAVEIGSTLNSNYNLSDLLTVITMNTNYLTNSVASTLMLLDEESGDLVFSVPTGPLADSLTDIRIPKGEGIAGWVAENEKPVLVSDVDKDSRFFPEIDRMSGFKTKSVLCVPVIAKDKMIGVLEAVNKTDDTSFTEEDKLILNIFASQAALAIENARFYEELLDSEEKYRQLFENSPVGVRIADEHGKIIKYNDAMLKPGGYSHEDILKINSVSDLYYDQNERERIFAEIKEQGFIDNTEVLFKRKDGTPFTAIMSVKPLKMGDKNGWQAIILDISDRKRSDKERESLINDLQNALAQVKTLKGLLPICASCKKIREDNGYWRQIESYISKNSEIEFSHGICPECANKYYESIEDSED